MKVHVILDGKELGSVPVTMRGLNYQPQRRDAEQLAKMAAIEDGWVSEKDAARLEYRFEEE